MSFCTFFASCPGFLRKEKQMNSDIVSLIIILICFVYDKCSWKIFRNIFKCKTKLCTNILSESVLICHAAILSTKFHLIKCSISTTHEL